MDRLSALVILAGVPLTALPPIPTIQPDAATRSVAAQVLAKYRGDAAFRAFAQRSPIAALRQLGMTGGVATRVLAYELGVTAAACGGTSTCLTKGLPARDAATETYQNNAALTTLNEIAACALTFGGHPPTDFAAHAGLPPATDAKAWRALIAAQGG